MAGSGITISYKKMKSIIKALLLICTLAVSATANAQIKKLSDIKSTTTYVLRNTNGYGYCIYNPNYDEKNPSLGEAEVDHPSGCVQDVYHDPIDVREKNNQWNIIKDNEGYYYLVNAGNGRYISNETVNQWGGGWWGGGSSTSYGIYFFTDEKVQISIEPYGDGVWMFRPKGAADTNNNTAYLCAASHSNTAMANWKPEDAGSTWEILTVEDDIRLYHTQYGGEVSGGQIVVPEDQAPLGEIPIEGDIRYFCFLDSQLIAIPEQFILDRQEDEQFLTLTLRGDTTITLSKYALEKETTEHPADLPVIESFKFNNKFNDQLHTDADGVIDNEKNTITAQVPTIGKSLVASIKLPDEEDALGTKVWVDGIRNVSKKTQRRFDKDYTYTVARPRQFIYKVVKTQEQILQIGGSINTTDKWLVSPIELTSSMLSTNWPSQNGNEQLPNLIDGNVDTYFHSNYSGTNNWKEGSYYGDGSTTYPYLQIELASPVEGFQFTYTTRNWDQHNGYSPQGFIIMTSTDGKKWTEEGKLGKDELPVGRLVQYESPAIAFSKASRFIRLQLTDTTRKNYLVLSEFGMSILNANPDYGRTDTDVDTIVVQPEKFEASFRPYGRDYNVHVDFASEMTNSPYNVPRIDIWFGDRNNWNGSMWIGRRGKEYYEEATMRIDGAGIYPDMAETPMLIRGRGNSSWSNSSGSKNPYRIKFEEKVKPFGMTKGKSWVLLANKQGNSMTTNAIAMKIADMVESDGCNHCIPVELYVNNQYRGSYNFTEKVGLSNNSINLEDDSHAVMLELDSYYDESYKFRDQNYNLYVNVKDPDLNEMTDANERNLFFQQVQNTFNNFTYTVKNNNYATKDPATSPLDVQSFVRAWLVTDLTRNTELQHPKSWYVYNEDVTNGHLPWHFGPVWDFDWSYGYEGHSTYFISDAETDICNYGNVGTPFFRQLARTSEVVKKEYYRLWTHFIAEGKLDELVDFCDDYFAFLEPSFKHNATMWGDGTGYAKTTENAKKWLVKRANYIYTHLQEYDLGNDIIDEPEEFIDQPDGELEAEKPNAIIDLAKLNKPVPVYNINGQKVATLRPSDINGHNLYPGIYIVGGKKIAIGR